MTDSKTRPDPPMGLPSGRVHVVGLGASAGGIRALQSFFGHVSADTQTAFVVVIHLSPDYESKLAEVLQKTSPLPVTQVRSKTAIEPGHVYVIPPNKALEVADGHLVLKEFARAEQRRAPVDMFFRTLADSHGSHAVCVVLSGTGPNGSTGLKRVKEYGGLVLAQEPGEAEYDDMPRNAIATGLVDYILPVAEMPARIAAYLARLDEDEPTRASVQVTEDSDALRDVLTLLRVRTGHDFSNYKLATLQRRIERRVNLRNVPDLGAYARLLRQEPDEAVALMRELLISVTNFFRDPAAWKQLEERVLPRLFQDRTPHDQVRIWVAGCATGEEAYSMAILLAEVAGRIVEPPLIQIFATDLDERAIAVAREGFYTEAEVLDVSEARLQRFFHRETGGYRVKRDVRELLLFAHHNLIKDPPFSHLDLVSCRNLLIYLNRSIQERVLETFHFALHPGGYLFLGSSESADVTNDLFLRFDAAAHVYESRTVTSRVAMPVSDSPLTVPRPLVRGPEVRPLERIAPVHLHQRLLEQYAPPSLIATEDFTVVHMSEHVGRYLQVPAGEPSRDLLAIVRQELRPDLRTALHQALQQRVPIEVRAVLVTFEDGDRRVDLSVRPAMRDGEPPTGFFLVLFTETAETVVPRPPVTLTSPAEPLTRQLEEELARVKAQLRTTIEQYETQAEEAKASNEELQAMNEELRSAAEELETSKEELQSVNEELTTVNQELKIKIEELSLTNNDFQNFISATDIGSIFLDRNLRVKFSTPRAQEVFNLLDTDIGRPLTDITTHLKYDRIHQDVRSVLERLLSLEQEVETDDGRWHLMRLLPYRTLDDRIDGVVLTFQDISTRRMAEQRVRQSEERLRLLIEGATDYAIFTVTETGDIDSWSQGAERLFGYRSDEAIGMPVEMLYTAEDRAGGLPQEELARAVATGRSATERVQVRRDGAPFYCRMVRSRLGGGGLGLAVIAHDLTRQREAAEALRQAQVALEERVARRTAELQTALGDQESARGQIRQLLHRLVSSQEVERSRIARDLHDSVGQQLTALRLVLERQGAGAPLESLERAFQILREMERDIDYLAWELRPHVLDELGLAAALPRFVSEWSQRVDIHAEVRVDRFHAGLLPPDTEVAFYRITQEALNNVAKHAQAGRVDVVLSATEHDAVLVIEDDGIGFNVEAAHDDNRAVGLLGMRERAALAGAELQIESVPGQGSTVYLRCPLQQPSSPA